MAVAPAAARVREASAADVPAIVTMLADDPLGATRERPGDPAYGVAFERITADPAQRLVVVDLDGEAVGALQLTVIPGLSRCAATRAHIESVRVRTDHRGRGIGGLLLDWAIATARDTGCTLVQLTTDVERPDARRFYERLGFRASHVGLKLALD